MIYENEKEMEQVTGKLKDNNFILQQEKAYLSFKQKVDEIKTRLS
jgi:hypothetical protein